ncbi:MAG TPA: type III-B CRISPR-associated protein Cas10/Cmr2 [Hyphomicrobiaceae bacterium]|nr:type III-B CRISPR-associated protein Cas10/Cmr2 [Hyphomicrobiaceae bacterium]
MTTHLLILTLGPVQDFIAQARRTRDLWYGSHLLSELGRAAARALAAGGANLVFPALKKGDSELEPCIAPLRADGIMPMSIANKLVAEVPSGVDAASLARKVRGAVMGYWREALAAPVKSRCAGLLAQGIDAIWDEQIDSFLEFSVSWAPLGDYAKTRRQLDSAIAARKLLRDFAPWKQVRGAVPKSSLNGARETVLRPSREREPDLARKYRIADGENLDAIDLVKRAGGEPEQFVPVVNVALASWIALASEEARSELQQVKNACREAGVARVARKDLPCAAPFPFDASVLLPSRWSSIFEEQGLEDDAERWGRKHIQPLLDKLCAPYPYVACLVADGDHVGRTIDSLGSAELHRGFSKALSRFANEARKIVEQQHRGVLVYAGGDDVLAFVPIPEALSCADNLRICFKTSIADATSSLPDDRRPTLSVGLGIGHVMESMGDLLALGREAEREAKCNRNALAIVVDKRSGGKRLWRACWSEDPVRNLRDSEKLLAERLPSRKAYEIAALLARLPQAAGGDDAGWSRVLSLEVRRCLSRVEGGSLKPEDAGLPIGTGNNFAELRRAVESWVARLLIARTLVQAAPYVRDRRQEVAA